MCGWFVNQRKLYASIKWFLCFSWPCCPKKRKDKGGVEGIVPADTKQISISQDSFTSDHGAQELDMEEKEIEESDSKDAHVCRKVTAFAQWDG